MMSVQKSTQQPAHLNIQEKATQLLKSLRFFTKCSEDFINNLAQRAHLISGSKGKVFFLHEDEATRFYIVAKGWVKLYREALDGSQAVVDILPEGHIFGDSAIFQDDLYPYTAEASENVEVFSFPLNDFKAEIEKNPQLALEMLSTMARYRRQQDQELEHQILQNAPQRIGCFLLRLVNQHQEDGTINIHLPYDKTLVASRLGMQPETFSRALGKLKNATGIKVKGATITLDSISQLSTYSCSACSSEFPCKDLSIGE